MEIPQQGIEHPRYKTVFIFGGTGSLGHAIHKAWHDRVNQFVVFSRDESKHWKLRQTFPRLNIKSELGNIASYDTVRNALRKHNPDIILIMSAMKHIDFCENFIENSISTNVMGILNVIAAIDEIALPALQKVCFVSTDKACAPINVYGMCKSIAEHVLRNRSATCRVPLVGVRYGNVLLSSGSVIPIFQNQSSNPQCHSITVTDERMTRFVISLKESIQLIEDALNTGRSGEIFIPVIPSMKITDLAQIFSDECGKPMSIVGMRPGEKLHESMYSELEQPFIERRNIEGRERYVLMMQPATFNTMDDSKQKHDILPSYSSNTGLMTPAALAVRIAQFLPSWTTYRPIVVVFGATGMLGRYVTLYFKQKGYNVRAISRELMNISESDNHHSLLVRLALLVNHYINDGCVIVNALGLTNKVQATDALFNLVNNEWVHVLGDFGKRNNVPVIHASTDCVFDGTAHTQNAESTPTNAHDIYGKSKALGDTHPWLSVVRVSIIGESARKKDGLLEWVKTKSQGSVVGGYTNHWWNGITCLEWCKVVENIIHRPYHEIIHVVPPYATTKYELLKQIARTFGLDVIVQPVESTISVFRVLCSEKGTIYPVSPLYKQLEELREFGCKNFM